MEKEPTIKIPEEVSEIINKLESAGFEAYIVGGCVRDLLLEKKPKDWDITTNAKPEEIQKIFPKSFYANKFLTVTAQTGSQDETLKEVEITTYRAEGKYTDKRHPDEVKFAKTLEEDLSRRDFTVNAMAISLNSKHETRNTKQMQNTKKQNPKPLSNFGNSNLSIVSDFGFRISDLLLIDPFDGQKDLRDKLIRAVGEPEKRFDEDALRMLRAARLATQLRFAIEEKTLEAVKKHNGLIQTTSKERIRDEFVKIIESDAAKNGMELLKDAELLKHIVPELLEGWEVTQNKDHEYTVWEHGLRSLEEGARRNYSPAVRLAALFHDIGKPRTKRGEGYNSTFYGHNVIGAEMVFQILNRLRFPREEAIKITRLVRHHMFHYKLKKDVEEEIRKQLKEEMPDADTNSKEEDADQNYVTDASIRRLIKNVGPENIEDLIKVRICDRMGMGRKKPVPYRLRHFQYRVEKVLREKEAVSVSMLKINGDDIKKILGLAQGPKIGHILNALLEEVIDEPKKNTKKFLEKRAKELNNLSDKELAILRQKAEEKVEELEDTRESQIKEKYHVR